MIPDEPNDKLSKHLPNPIYQRVTHGAKLPTFRQAALMMLVMALSTVLLYLAGGMIRSGLFLAALLATPLLAPLTAGAAALLAANDARQEGYTLQKITMLPPQTMVQGYSRAALFRAYLPIAVVIGLSPALVWSAQISVRPGDCHLFLPGSTLAGSLPSYVGIECAPDDDIRFALLPLGHLLALSAAALAAFPAALFGVWLGLTLRRPAPAMGLAVLATFSVTFGHLIVLGPSIAPSYQCQLNCTVFHPWPDPLIWFGAAVVALALLTLGLYWLALRAV